jgi:hypothetical protein
MRKNDLSVRVLVSVGLGLALALSAPLVSAKGSKASSSSAKEKKKVLIGAFEGPKSAEARKSVIAALKEDGDYDIAETSEVKPGADDKTFAGASAGATAVLVGRLKKGVLVVSVHNGADGALVQDVEIKGESAAKLNKNIADTFGLSVADAIAQTKPAASDKAKADEPKADGDEEKTDKPAEEEAKSEPASDASPYGHSPLELEAGLRAVHRSFTYHDTPAELFPGKGIAAPQTYKLPLGPALFVDGTLYPGAFGTRGIAGNFGLTGGYELNIGTKSVYNVIDPTSMKQVEKKLTTNASQYFIGVKARIPISVHELGVVVAYGQQTFNLVGDEAAPTVPDVSYKFIKAGLEGRFRFDAVSIGLHAGTRLVSNTGGLDRDWFPKHVKTQSLDAGLNVGYAVTPLLEVLVGIDITRYAFNFNPVTAQNSRIIAGGATDQFTSAFLGLRYSLAGHN